MIYYDTYPNFVILNGYPNHYRDQNCRRIYRQSIKRRSPPFTPANLRHTNGRRWYVLLKNKKRGCYFMLVYNLWKKRCLELGRDMFQHKSFQLQPREQCLQELSHFQSQSKRIVDHLRYSSSTPHFPI